MNQTILIENKQHLSDFYSELPDHCILNKGITGCGGTYCELHSNRDSIILVPTIELVKNKISSGIFGLYGKVKNEDLLSYINSDISYKKIIATYDALSRIINIVPNYQDYFLLIDEYHLLFNQYSFRNEAVLNILKNYNLFKKFCFMSATPLDNNIILDELKYLDTITLNWNNSTPVKVDIKDCRYTTQKLLDMILPSSNCNYHIFLNSVKTIRDIVIDNDIDDYKIVCSQKARKGFAGLSYGSTKDKPCKYNFYTSCSFEGTDIYDPIGKTIILCDTNIATTILDISTLIRQICGRLRDSIYKDEVTMILNSSKHRYASLTRQEFADNVATNISDGKRCEEQFKKFSDRDRALELRKYNPETYNSFYANLYKGIIYYDDNLRKVDEYNYKLVSEVYLNSLSVLKEMENNNMLGSISNHSDETKWIKNQLYKREYTYEELESLFKDQFINSGLNWDHKKVIKYYFPPHEKLRKIIQGRKQTVYRFSI